MAARARDEQLIGAEGGIVELRAAAAASARAAALFREAGGFIGRAVADLVNLLAPDRVIVSGEGVAGWPLLRDGFDEAFRAGLLDFHADVLLVVEPWEDGNWARGAAALVLGSLFTPANGAVLADQLQSRLHSVTVAVPA